MLPFQFFHPGLCFKWIELLKKQLARKIVFINPQDEATRTKLLNFVEEFEAGRTPEYVELKSVFVDRLGIQDAKTYKGEIKFLEYLIEYHEDDLELKSVFVDRLGFQDAKTWRGEMKFLEDLIKYHEGDLQPFSSLLTGIVAVTRYCRILFFGFEVDEECKNFGQCEELQKDLISEETFNTIVKDFSCPISLELMHDPVIVSTGQTYDRASITEWLREGNDVCPKTGLTLENTEDLVPNRALRSLIFKWCTACGIPSGFDPMETSSAVSPTRAVTEAEKATGKLLIDLLSCESISVNIYASHELYLLALSRKANQAVIAGAIPLLQRLLLSHHPLAQENSVKVISFLSLHASNRSLIMEQVVESVVHVLINGHTDEARENAATTLSCLCEVHDYRARIADITGAIDALLRLMEKRGRGKIVAFITLSLLFEHVDNRSKLIDAGALKCFAEALGDEELADDAAAVLVSLIRQPHGAEAVKNDHVALAELLVLARYHWSSLTRYNAIVVLRELYPDCVSLNIVTGVPAA